MCLHELSFNETLLKYSELVKQMWFWPLLTCLKKETQPDGSHGKSWVLLPAAKYQSSVLHRHAHNPNKEPSCRMLPLYKLGQVQVSDKYGTAYSTQMQPNMDAIILTYYNLTNMSFVAWTINKMQWHILMPSLVLFKLQVSPNVLYFHANELFLCATVILDIQHSFTMKPDSLRRSPLWLLKAHHLLLWSNSTYVSCCHRSLRQNKHCLHLQNLIWCIKQFRGIREKSGFTSTSFYYWLA